MALTKVPLVPQWNLTHGCKSTPDGSGFLYAGMRSINYIGCITAGESPQIKAFHTRQSILSLDIDPAWQQKGILDKSSSFVAAGECNNVKARNTDNGQRYFAVLSLDNSIQIWDFDRGIAKFGHKAHFNVANYKEGGIGGSGGGLSHFDRVVMGYMSNRNVFSMDAREMVIYCVTSNTYCRRPTFLPARNQHFTILSCAPYNENIFAVGTNRGLILLCDLQRQCVLFTLRGHDASITALSWTSDNSNNNNNNAEVKSEDQPMSSNDDIFDIYDYNYLENEFGAPCKVPAVKDEKTTSSQMIPSEKTATTELEFIEDCKNLKRDLENREKLEELDNADPDTAVTLEDCQKAMDKRDDNNDGINNASVKGSLQLDESKNNEIDDEDDADPLTTFSSDEDVGVDGSQRQSKQQQILHQAEVHATQSLERQSHEHSSINVVNEEDNTKKQATEMIATQVKEEKNEKSQILLASASVDGNFWVWNVNTGAACDNFNARYITGSTTTSGSANNFHNSKNTHIEVAWLPNLQLLTTNKHGDLSLWLLKPGGLKHGLGEAQKHHSYPQCRYKFKETKRNFAQRNVVSLSVAVETMKGDDMNRVMVWCVTSNREIVCEEITGNSINNKMVTDRKPLLLKFSCASTGINAMRECPDDMNKIALALSDRRVGILDISKMSVHNVHIQNFGLRVDAQVLSLAWHPDNRRLAFGTAEGRVGILNSEDSKQQPQLLNPMCGKPIFSMEWDGKVLFVVWNDIMGVYEFGGKTKDSREGRIIRGLPNISAVTIRHNYIFIGTRRGRLVIYKRVYTSEDASGDPWHLQLIQEVDVAGKYITEISWSPIIPERFAVATNTNKIQVLEFIGNENDKGGNGVGGDETSSKSVVRTLHRISVETGKMANSCLKWSNSDGGRFLTCGSDGCVRVWNVEDNDSSDMKTENLKIVDDDGKEITSGKCTQTFLKQFHCPMNCGLFLPTDEGIILCAGKSTSIEFIDIRIEQSDTGTANFRDGSCGSLDNVQWAVKMVSDQIGAKKQTSAEKRRNRRVLVGLEEEILQTIKYNACQGKISPAKKEIGEVKENGESKENEESKGNGESKESGESKEDTSTESNENEEMKESQQNKMEEIDESNESYLLNGAINEVKFHETDNAQIALKCGYIFLKTPQTLLHLTAKELNRNAEILLKQTLYPKKKKFSGNSSLCHRLFGTRNEAKQLLTMELQNHQHSEAHGGIASLFLPQMTCKIEEEVLRCIEAKTLTAWHVSLAPSVSYRFWQNCVTAYADQLLESGHVLQAATYLMALHQQRKVIELLTKKQYFKEALLLGRVYLEKNDPLFQKASEQWINHLEYTGNLPGAALISMLAGAVPRALDVLAKVRKPSADMEKILDALRGMPQNKRSKEQNPKF